MHASSEVLPAHGAPAIPEPASTSRSRLLPLTIAAIGVVYGDIGTSPLYAIRECFAPEQGLVVGRPDVLGVLSLVFWSLVLVISLKYLVFVLRADNHGEGGILALLALVVPKGRSHGTHRRWLAGVGLFGAALLYGDGMLTPAISVLSAVEGLAIVAPGLSPWVVPVTVAILLGLFAVQPFGTAKVGAVFGPVTIVWFLALGAMGIGGILRAPEVLLAVDPRWALGMFADHGVTAFAVLGVVFLVVTGGEALYADMGHFGAAPIRLAWFALALPCLLLEYFGQGALLLVEPGAVDNPFYRLAPSWALVPVLALATAATIIASQAVISGAFSLTRQAVGLGFAPRLEIRHTSASEHGQIYVPVVNVVLAIGTLAIVVGFGTSAALAGAYGVAVTTTMVITTALLLLVARERWGWSWAAAGGLVAVFLVFDLAFFGANVAKVAAGGWLPLLIAIAITAAMTTWRRGRMLLTRRIERDALPLRTFVDALADSDAVRVDGTAVFLTAEPEVVPQSWLHNLKHNRVIHRHVIVLDVQTLDVPRVAAAERLQREPLSKGVQRVTLQYGFMESPDVPQALAAVLAELGATTMTTSYFLGRERIVAATRHRLWVPWRRVLFAAMLRNARDASLYFRLPPNRVIELGALVEL
ncbi:MAG: potassium transporter Kup [Nannocystaceae bacterium]|nr:potassium transporter Kup [Nannocystaceae bacterium]